MTRVILWDVDGTLLWAGSSGRVAFEVAVREVLGRSPSGDGVMMGGKTDPQIVLEILADMVASEDEARHHLPGVLQALERAMEDALETVRREGGPHPGVPDLLERLAGTRDVVQTVLTGNLKANARLKLAAFDLDRWLDLEVGAYGSDHEDRTRLVPLALERVSRGNGLRVHPEDVWVVGDTPADLACARAGGVRCLLVATGRVPMDELQASGPDALLADLADTERALSILLDGAPASLDR